MVVRQSLRNGNVLDSQYTTLSKFVKVVDSGGQCPTHRRLNDPQQVLVFKAKVDL